MNARLQRIVDEVRGDTGSGAAELTRRVLGYLLQVLSVDGELEPSDLRDFAFQLHLAKRSMAPLFNLSNSVLLSLEGREWRSGLVDRLSVYHKELEMANSSIAEMVRSGRKAKRIMTISYSSTVLASLRLMAATMGLEVVVPVSLPMGEGREMAKVLSEGGIRVEIIQDSMIFSVMEEMELTLVGADAVTPRGVINKVGTLSMVAASKHFGVPCHALCDWTKVSPAAMMDPLETQTRVGANLTMRDQVFEIVPLDLFTSVITDRGELIPDEIRREMELIPLSSAWASFS